MIRRCINKITSKNAFRCLPPQNPEAEMSTLAPSSLLAAASKGLICKRLQRIHENGVFWFHKMSTTLAVLDHMKQLLFS